jgi:hypothetical protein
MKRILSALVLAAAVSIAASSGAAASSAVAKKAPVAHARLAAARACPVSDPSQCGPWCTHGQATAAAFTAAAAGPTRVAAVPAVQASAKSPRLTMNGRACPVSDPSKCPASCQRANASAVAAKTANR